MELDMGSIGGIGAVEYDGPGYEKITRTLR